METNERALTPEQEDKNENGNQPQTAEHPSGNPVRNETDPDTTTPEEQTENKPEDTTKGQ